MIGPLRTSIALSISIVLSYLTYTQVVPGTAEIASQALTNLKVEVTGTRKVDGENKTGPIAGAEVLVRSELQDVDFEERLPTDSEGIAKISNVPRGPVLIQVTAQGWNSGGIRQELKNKDETIKIVLTGEEIASPSPTPAPSPSPSASPSPSPSPFSSIVISYDCEAPSDGSDQKVKPVGYGK